MIARTNPRSFRAIPLLAGLGALATCAPGEGHTPTIGFGLSASIEPAVAVMQDYLSEHPLPFALEWDVPTEETDTETADGAIEQALSLVANPGIIAVVGHAGSRGTLSAAPIYQGAGVPLLAPSATSDAMGELGSGVFRMVPGNQEEGRFLAEYALHELGAREAVVFFVTDEFGTSLRDGIADAFAEGGGVILDEVPMVEGTDSDIEGLVAQAWSRGTPDVVFLAVRSQETILVMNEVERVGHRLSYLAGDGATEEDMIRAGVPAESWERFHRVRFWHQSVGDHDLIQRYRRIHGADPSDGSALQLEAIAVLVEALRAVGPDPEEIMEYLESLGRERPPFEGPSGPVDFTRGFSGGFFLVHPATDSILATMER